MATTARELQTDPARALRLVAAPDEELELARDEALAWFHRERAWEHRLETLREAAEPAPLER